MESNWGQAHNFHNELSKYVWKNLSSRNFKLKKEGKSLETPILHPESTAMTSYSFHYLPEQDRLAMTFTQSEGTPLAPVQLTRRLLKLMGSYLRRYIEKNTSLPDSVTIEDKDDIFQFMHMSELEDNPPTWESNIQKKVNAQDLSTAGLISRIDIKYANQAVKLVFSQQQKQLVSLSLTWRSLHIFFYSLAEMSRKADWNLEVVFEWSGQALALQETVQRQ